MVKKVPLIGGASVSLTTPTRVGSEGIAVDAANVYWLDVSGSSSVVMKTALRDGTTVTLVRTGTRVFGFAVDGSSAYYGDVGSPIKKVPLNGGSPVIVAVDPTPSVVPRAMAVDATNVYWTNGPGGGVMKSPK